MWKELTGDSLWDLLSQPEMDFFNTQGLENGQTDRVTNIVEWVAAMVRGKIAANPENLVLMTQDESLIPDELYLDALQIARYNLLTAYPQGKVFLDDARMQGYRDAMSHLSDVASGKLIVQGPIGVVNTSGVVLWNSRDTGDSRAIIYSPRIDWGFWH